jgi:hypothetical protein
MDRLKQLVSKRLQTQGQGPHPDADTLSAYAENALSVVERELVLGHVVDCRDCRDILFLAQPDSDETQVVAAYRPARIWQFAFRWGAVAASLVVVAGGVFLTRQEFFRAEHKSGQAAAVQYHDELEAKQAPLKDAYISGGEPAAPPAAGVKENARTDLALATAPKIRPQEKHMTAKLQSTIQFDSSDQVQMAPAANARAEVNERDQNVPTQTKNEVTSSEMLDQAAAAPAAMAKSKDAEVLPYAAGMGAGQSSAANKLKGTVIDPAGAAVANAQVTLVGPSAQKTVTSDSAGKFSFDGLTPGSYALKAKAAGFRQTEIGQVAVLDHKTAELAVKLDVGSMAEPVEVSAAAPTAEAREEAQISGALLSTVLPSPQTTAEVVARDEKQAATLSRKKAATKTDTRSASNIIPAQWTLSADGNLQRSVDSGKSWEIVPVGNTSGFRAIFSANSDIWVGGKAGALYHSSDSGQTWAQVVASDNGEKLTTDVTRIEFADGANGSVSAVNGEIWRTSDGGQTWRKK